LGLGFVRIKARIVLPQAFRIALPTLVNEYVTVVTRCRSRATVRCRHRRLEAPAGMAWPRVTAQTGFMACRCRRASAYSASGVPVK